MMHNLAEGLAPSDLDVPERVGVSADGRTLNLTHAGGERHVLSSSRLRQACRCAQCVRARVDGTFVPDCQDIGIISVDPMGHYGIAIAFSDGHARGIYPWGYLANLLKE